MQALMRYQLEKTMNSWSRKEFLSPGGWRTRVIRNEKAAYEFNQSGASTLKVMRWQAGRTNYCTPYKPQDWRQLKPYPPHLRLSRSSIVLPTFNSH